ncbi:MAG: hypothetical protein ACI86H_002476 [bacterium]|jgi:hypothetical protein
MKIQTQFMLWSVVALLLPLLIFLNFFYTYKNTFSSLLYENAQLQSLNLTQKIQSRILQEKLFLSSQP